MTQTHKLTFTQKGQDALPSTSRLEYFVHGHFVRFEGDKGLTYAKWCGMPLLLEHITQGDIDDALEAFEDVRDGKHQAEIDAHGESIATAEEEAEIGAALERAQGAAAGRQERQEQESPA